MKTYKEYLQHVEQRAKELGMSLNEFCSTDEYKNLYPEMNAQHQKEYGQYKRIRRKRKNIMFGSDEFYAMLFAG